MTQAWLPDIDRGYGDAYVRLADAIEGAIRSGRLRAGERLPTHRALARQLGVAISTVTRGYTEATRRGLIESTVGRGTTFVIRLPRGGPPPDDVVTGSS